MANCDGFTLRGFEKVSPRTENCGKAINPNDPDRDIYACLNVLQDEVASLDSSLADLFDRLHPIVTDKINACENAPGVGGSTILGNHLATLANRVASMRRAVNSYTDNLGV